MADIVEGANDTAAAERVPGQPRDDRLAIRIRRLKSITGDDVCARRLGIDQQQATAVEKVCAQCSQQSIDGGDIIDP